MAERTGHTPDFSGHSATCLLVGDVASTPSLVYYQGIAVSRLTLLVNDACYAIIGHDAAAKTMSELSPRDVIRVAGTIVGHVLRMRDDKRAILFTIEATGIEKP
jgi:hypothetical protein